MKKPNYVDIITNVKYYLLTLLMLQTVNYRYWWLFNCSSWFVASIFILYLIAPFILKFIYNNNFRKYLVCFLSIAILLCLCIHKNYLPSNSFNDFYMVSPFYWCFYYAIGLIIGSVNPVAYYDIFKKNIVRPIVIFCTFFVYFIGIYIGYNTEITKFLYFIVLSIFVCMLAFYYEKFDNNISNSVFDKLGSISYEFYLIHYIVVSYGSIILIHYFGKSTFNLFIYIFILFFVSLFGCFFVHKIMKKFKFLK